MTQPDLSRIPVTPKIPATAIADELAKVPVPVAKAELEPRISEISMAKIAMSLGAGEDFCRKFAISRKPSTQSKIPPSDIATVTTRSFPESVISESDECLAAE